MAKKKILRAGFIPYYIENKNVYVMLMKPSDEKYGGDKFQLAKGRVESGETSLEAALREANEELGLKYSNIEDISYLGTFLGYTDVYYGKVIDKNDFQETTYETGETAWMTVEEFLDKGRDLHKPLFKKFYLTIIELFPQNQ